MGIQSSNETKEGTRTTKMIRHFTLSTCGHGTPAIQVQNPTELERMFLRRAVLTQFTDDVFYQKKQDAKPFLQSETKDFIMIEFWGGQANAELFVDWINSQDPEVQKAKEMCARWVE